jgi:hypothetical protein
MIRASRPWLTTIVILAALALVGRAQAGALGTQFASGVCSDAFATDSMSDPNTTGFPSAGVDTCGRLCRSSRNDCKDFSKRAASCRTAWAEGIFKYNKANCAVVNAPADVKACVANESSALKSRTATFRDDLASALTACDTWGTTCLATCQPPL